MISPFTSGCRFACAVLLASISTTATAQTIDAPADHELHPVWGGQNQATHTMMTTGGLRTIVGTGGGALRVSDPTINFGEWFYAQTPEELSGIILDIEFLDESIGFACGRNGIILKTSDGGQTWSALGPLVTDPCDDLATLWSIHPLSEDVLVIGGLWLARVSVNGGQDWEPLVLHDVAAPGQGDYQGAILDEKQFHFYAVSAIGGLASFRGAMCGEWERPDGTHAGVVFFTDAALGAESGSGRHWRMVLDDSDSASATPPPPSPGDMREPWALAFEPGTDPLNAVGYVAGAKGIGAGRVYRTNNGGQDWGYEDDFSQAVYGLSAEAGEAMLGTYGGGIATRKLNGTWDHVVNALPGPANSPIPGDTTTVPVNFIDSSAPGNYVVAGEFGTTMSTTDYGKSWKPANPHIGEPSDLYEVRLQGIHAMASDHNRAFAVGQGGYMLDTSDGGDNWSLSRPSTGYLWEVEFRDANAGIAVGDHESGALNVRWTVDGGATWNPPIAVLDVLGEPGTKNYKLRDVTLVGARDGWAVGHRSANGSSAVFYTRDDGRHWFKLASPPDDDVVLTGIVFPEPTEGLVVGWAKEPSGGTVARAYRLTLTPNGTLLWDDVHPPHPSSNPFSSNPVSRKLLGVDSVGTSIGSATIYAVGNGGMVLRWNGTELVDEPDVYRYDASSGDVISRALSIDLETVAISPNGRTVLIGGQYDIDISKAADFGRMLKLDASGWSTIKTNSSKNIVSMTLLSETSGFVLGNTAQKNASSGTGFRLDECDGYSHDDVESSSFDQANGPAPVILKFRMH